MGKSGRTVCCHHVVKKHEHERGAFSGRHLHPGCLEKVWELCRITHSSDQVTRKAAQTARAPPSSGQKSARDPDQRETPVLRTHLPEVQRIRCDEVHPIMQTSVRNSRAEEPHAQVRVLGGRVLLEII